MVISGEYKETACNKLTVAPPTELADCKNPSVLLDVDTLLVGGLFGVLMALILFYSDKISLLFINELNSNKEVCSVPSKQMFRCSVFKDGMIIGSSVSA